MPSRAPSRPLKRRTALGGAAALALAPHVARAQQAVDLLLVLAVDASGSVDNDRFALQLQGYADAFRSPSVLTAIQGGALGAISVTMVQWTGPGQHASTVGWTVVRDAASAAALAQAIGASPRLLYGGGTSISGAIAHGMTLFPAETGDARRVIDISGDGRNNRGPDVAPARAAALAAGITINGLPILTLEPDLEDYYRDEVIGGPGAFVVAAADYNAFAAAILRKLISEIS
jgi:hypothetical protein